MYRVSVHGFIFLGFLGVSLSLILTPQNDWIPISKDEVLRRLNRLNRRNTDNSHFHSITNEAGTDLISELSKSTILNTFNGANNENIVNNAIKLIKPINTIKLDEQSAFYPVALDTITSVNDLQSSLEQNHEQAGPQKKAETQFKKSLEFQENNKNDAEGINNTNSRKPKAVAADQFANKIKHDEGLTVASQKKDQEETEKESSQVTAQVNRKIYQVTEHATDVLENEQNNIEERTGYFYIPPKLNQDNSMENNLTKIFLDILSKHNIRPGDALPNYSLSRRQKNQNPLNGYMLITIPVRDFAQFNTLSLDPLAVLLSNYGYYLPGSYGIRGKYRNLYGYLASNNIHNNKPFGSYKIFSDTDSSN